MWQASKIRKACTDTRRRLWCYSSGRKIQIFETRKWGNNWHQAAHSKVPKRVIGQIQFRQEIYSFLNIALCKCFGKTGKGEIAIKKLNIKFTNYGWFTCLADGDRTIPTADIFCKIPIISIFSLCFLKSICYLKYLKRVSKMFSDSEDQIALQMNGQSGHNFETWGTTVWQGGDLTTRRWV